MKIEIVFVGKHYHICFSFERVEDTIHLIGNLQYLSWFHGILFEIVFFLYTRNSRSENACYFEQSISGLDSIFDDTIVVSIYIDIYIVQIDIVRNSIITLDKT